MANEGKRSGCFFWILLGFLAGVLVTLAFIFLGDIKSGSDYQRGDQTEETDAPAPPAVKPEVAPPPVAPPAPVAKTRPHAPGIDPSTDEQINDDLAASGATTRRKPAPATPPAPLPDTVPQAEDQPTN